MPCSAYTLSLATIAAVISVALVAIAFSTDNWSRITVDRLKLEVRNKKKILLLLPTTRPYGVVRAYRVLLALGGGRWHLKKEKGEMEEA